jgi:DNA-binding SARP family transcriptional activator
VKFRILGVLTVHDDDGAELCITQQLHRSALAVLLFYAGQPVRSPQLCDLIWGANPPRSARSALRVCIHGVRSALLPTQRLDTVPAGYRFRVLPGELDLMRFRDLYSQGRQALDSRDPNAAKQSFAAALSVCGDLELGDLPDTPVMAAERANLLYQRADSEEALIHARLALGEHGAVVGQLRSMVIADPLREHAWALLMTALCQSGRPAEALGAYAQARASLVRELGIEPGPELQQLLRRIMVGDPGLGPPGYSIAASGSISERPHKVRQLPAPVADFTGRAEPRRQVSRLLRAPGVPVVVVNGLPGAGKTALALAAAQRLTRAFRGGQLYAALGGCAQPRDPQEAVAEMLRALGVPPDRIPPAGREREALYRSVLAGQEILVLADDAVSAAQVRPLLPGTAGCALLVTSRHSLADLAGARVVELAEFEPGEAVTLLGRIIGHDRVAAEPEAAARIAAACGHLPLAVRIAGAKLAARPGWPLETFAQILGAQPISLDELTVGDLAVRACVASSYLALDARARRVFSLLSLAGARDFPGTAAMALSGDPCAAVIADQLADRGLLTRVPARDGLPPHYRMHLLLRAFAAEHVAGAKLVRQRLPA